MNLYCVNCGNFGHIYTFCPKPIMCNNCHKEGHFRAKCPLLNNKNNIKCFFCGQTGHKKDECPKRNKNANKNQINSDNNLNNQEQEIKCFNCGKLGHKSYECPEKSQKKVCYKCKQPGHISAHCPNVGKINNNLNQINNNEEDDKESNAKCPICFATSQAGCMFYTSRCGHILCKQCWNSLFIKDTKVKCPLCKKLVEKKDLIEIFI